MRAGVRLAATFAIGSLLAACGGSPDPSSAPGTVDVGGGMFPDLNGQTVTFVDYGGPTGEAMKRVYYGPFAEKTGLKVLHDAPYDPAKHKAQVDAARVTWDVVNGASLTAISFCRTGLLEPLDPSLFDEIDPKFKTGDCAVPINTYASVLAYDKKFEASPPAGWADYFDLEKYPGKRGMWKSVGLHQLEIALLADGVSPEELYPLDLDRAIAKLDTIKDQIVFYESLAQGGEQMLSGAVVMTDTAGQRGMAASRDGAQFLPQWNQAVIAWEAYGIPKGSKNKQAAQALLRYMGTAEAQSRVAGEAGMGSTAKDPVEAPGLDALHQLWLPAGDNLKTAVTVDPAWWADHYDEATERFNTWTTG
jgi:putative spermidine/putrescine transport system substrate-binding protein